MKSTVEPLEGNKVKLSVEVDESEFEKDVDAAFRKLAREVRIPGFRPGRAPRRVLEARLGSGVGRSQALHDALPEYYEKAVREHDVDVIAAPEIDITDGEEEGQVVFDAVVEVRPRITVPGYQNLRVTMHSLLPTDEEIDAQLDRLRSQYAELEVVDRPAVDDDVVTIDINGTQDGEPIEGLTADDYGYQVGSATIVPEFDEQLRGAKVGDILEFDASHPQEGEDDLHFRLLVKEVKARILPDLDDDFATEASEFETLAELRDDLTTRLERIRRAQGAMQLQQKVGEALADLVEEEVPDALVAGEMQQRVQELAMQLQSQGLDMETWLQASGRSEEELVAELRESAVERVKVDLALRAVAEAQEIEADDDDLDAELTALAQRLDQPVDEVRQRFERADQVGAVRSDIRKRKAFEWLLERVEIVDEDGKPLDRSAFEVDTDDEDDAGEGEADAVGPDDPTPGDDTAAPDHTDDTADTDAEQDNGT